jgi:hypothetical protein
VCVCLVCLTKTLLANAIAGELGVAFFSVSAPEIVTAQVRRELRSERASGGCFRCDASETAGSESVRQQRQQQQQQQQHPSVNRGGR